jgi:thiol-disulfide isomerase/thioredoxin
MIDESKKSEGMSMAEKESQYNLIYLGFLFENGSYPEYLAYIKEHPAVINGTEIKQMTLLVYTKTNDIEAAFGLIDTLMDQPNQFYSWLSTDMELAPLMTDPRWAAKLEQMKGLWELGAGDRKSAVIAKKFSRPAPLWSLKDTAGNTINLADLKGQVVILDFWATWCGPCKMAMPVIDEWMKTKMPAGVKVFSVNVWERDPSKAQPFMEQNGYGMTLLYGYNDLSKEYGFDGIPYLCVIDKEGNIRFEETGFAEELAENLGFWTEDLLK